MRKRLILLLPLLMLSVVGAYAQNVLRGIVISATDQEPIIGASVVEKGSSNGTVTDLSGQFQISVKKDAKLVISFIGYQTKEITPAGSGEIKVELSEDNNLLDDIVVVGYGTMRKSDLTGAVTRANIQAFEKSTNTNLLQSLQGTVPGLNVGQASSAGADPAISVRGVTVAS